MGLAAAGAAWYASDSLRHRREKGEGCAVPDEEVDVGSHAFLRAAEALTAAPISWGDDVELLVNGDRIFPPMRPSPSRLVASRTRSTHGPATP